MKIEGHWWAFLVLALALCVALAGCGQRETPSAGAKLVVQGAFGDEGELAEAAFDWSERAAYDEAFAESRYATLAVWSEPCACGGERICYVQSYTDASKGAAAVRDCADSTLETKDNLVTEEYAASAYCPACGDKTLDFSTEDVWMKRGGMTEPHYHLADAAVPADNLRWCKIYVDYYDRRQAQVYTLQDGEKQLAESMTLDAADDPLTLLCEPVWTAIH